MSFQRSGPRANSAGYDASATNPAAMDHRRDGVVASNVRATQFGPMIYQNSGRVIPDQFAARGHFAAMSAHRSSGIGISYPGLIGQPAAAGLRQSGMAVADYRGNLADYSEPQDYSALISGNPEAHEHVARLHNASAACSRSASTRLVGPSAVGSISKRRMVSRMLCSITDHFSLFSSVFS